MNLIIDDSLKESYIQYRERFFEKFKTEHPLKKEIEELQSQGFSEDSTFLSHLLGGYKGLIRLGYDV